MVNAFSYNLVPAYFDEIREQKQINARYRIKRILEATLLMRKPQGSTVAGKMVLCALIWVSVRPKTLYPPFLTSSTNNGPLFLMERQLAKSSLSGPGLMQVFHWS